MKTNLCFFCVMNQTAISVNTLLKLHKRSHKFLSFIQNSSSLEYMSKNNNRIKNFKSATDTRKLFKYNPSVCFYVVLYYKMASCKHNPCAQHRFITPATRRAIKRNRAERFYFAHSELCPWVKQTSKCMSNTKYRRTYGLWGSINTY